MGLLIKILKRWEGVGSRSRIELDRVGIVAGEFGWFHIIVIVHEVVVVVKKYVFRTGTFANVVRRVPKRRLVVEGWWL